MWRYYDVIIYCSILLNTVVYVTNKQDVIRGVNIAHFLPLNKYNNVWRYYGVIIYSSTLLNTVAYITNKQDVIYCIN